MALSRFVFSKNLLHSNEFTTNEYFCMHFLDIILEFGCLIKTSDQNYKCELEFKIDSKNFLQKY